MTFDKLSIKQKLVAGTAVLLVVVGLFISVFFPMRQNTAMKKYLVDKASVGPVNLYTFDNVRADHLLEAVFVRE